jgi:hypothetical protein
MSEKKYVVPEGMLKAAIEASDSLPYMKTDIRRGLEAAFRWLAENPIVPTDKQVREMIAPKFGINSKELNGNMIASGITAAITWQRRMFLVSEPEVPEEIKDLLIPNFFNSIDVILGIEKTRSEDDYRKNIIEAYHRGRLSAKV